MCVVHKIEPRLRQFRRRLVVGCSGVALASFCMSMHASLEGRTLSLRKPKDEFSTASSRQVGDQTFVLSFLDKTTAYGSASFCVHEHFLLSHGPQRRLATADR